jgi:hypothetical protein
VGLCSRLVVLQTSRAVKLLNIYIDIKHVRTNKGTPLVYKLLDRELTILKHGHSYVVHIELSSFLFHFQLYIISSI